MERLSAGTGSYQDPIVALLGCGPGGEGLDRSQLPGRHRRYPDLFTRLKANTELNEFTQCWEWTGLRDRYGYPKITIRVDGYPTAHYAHRVMLELVHGYLFPFDEAGHLCDNPCCINPQHLEVQTRAMNLSQRKGFAPVVNGERWIPVLYPIEDWAPHPAIVKLIAPQSNECPF